MNKRISKKTLLKLSNGEYIETAVYFCEGGLSYWDYKQKPKCYWVSCDLVSVEHKDGYSIVTSRPCSGNSISKMLFETTRNTPKRRKEALELAQSIVSDLHDQLIAKLGLAYAESSESALSANEKGEP